MAICHAADGADTRSRGGFTGCGRCEAGGTLHADGKDVIVAIPIWQQRVSPVLDTATRLLVLTCQEGREIARRAIQLDSMTAADIAGCMAEQRVNVLLCAAISHELQSALERGGVQVCRHLCGDVERILQAFACGRLDSREFHMPGCRCVHCYASPGKGSRQRRVRRCRRPASAPRRQPLTLP